jgi:hypothetical protein
LAVEELGVGGAADEVVVDVGEPAVGGDVDCGVEGFEVGGAQAGEFVVGVGAADGGGDVVELRLALLRCVSVSEEDGGAAFADDGAEEIVVAAVVGDGVDAD